MELFDSHLHLDDEAFAADLEDVISRARAAGIVGMVTVGTGVASSRAAVALADRLPGVFAAVAVHPHDAYEASDEAMAELETLTAHPKVVAIGETGLDFARQRSPREVQHEAFRRHIRLARKAQLPLIIHCRDAHADVLQILREEDAGPVIMHAFSGSVDVARECCRRGYAVSLAGPVTYRNARTALDVARAVPLESLLVETDAPVLAPEPYRGRRNEPAYLVHTVERIATLRDLAPEEIASATTENARAIYRAHHL